jgi:hypothetical protein
MLDRSVVATREARQGTNRNSNFVSDTYSRVVFVVKSSSRELKNVGNHVALLLMIWELNINDGMMM